MDFDYQTWSTDIIWKGVLKLRVRNNYQGKVCLIIVNRYDYARLNLSTYDVEFEKDAALVRKGRIGTIWGAPFMTSKLQPCGYIKIDFSDGYEQHICIVCALDSQDCMMSDGVCMRPRCSRRYYEYVMGLIHSELSGWTVYLDMTPIDRVPVTANDLRKMFVRDGETPSEFRMNVKDYEEVRRFGQGELDIETDINRCRQGILAYMCGVPIIISRENPPGVIRAFYKDGTISKICFECWKNGWSTTMIDEHCLNQKCSEAYLSFVVNRVHSS